MLTNELDTLTAQLSSQEVADWEMHVTGDGVYYTNATARRSQWIPPIVEGGFSLVPLRRAQCTLAGSGPGAGTEEIVSRQGDARTYDGDKKCKNATLAMTELEVQMSELYERICDHAGAQSSLAPAERHVGIQTGKKLCEEFADLKTRLNNRT
jgi:hypothetical protein